MKKELKYSLLLLLAAFIWGLAFSFQSIGGKAMGSLTFSGIRSLVGFLSVLPVIWKLSDSFVPDRNTLKAGFLCGLCLTFACNLQQLSLQYTSPGKAGFITAAYMIIVAVISLFTKRKPSVLLLFSILLGAVGLWFICIPEGESMKVNLGDILCFFCAVFYALHILLIDHFVKEADPLKMAAIQFLVTGLITTVLAIFIERTPLNQIANGIIPILYVGILSTGAAYSLQILGLKYVNPVAASLIMSMESVFSVLGEFVIFGTILSPRAMVGCLMMFVAVILTQLKGS